MANSNSSISAGGVSSSEFGRFRAEMTLRFDRLKGQIERLEDRMDARLAALEKDVAHLTTLMEGFAEGAKERFNRIDEHLGMKVAAR